MLQPYGTPEDGDVPVWVATKNRAEWAPPAGGSSGITPELQNMLNALAIGQGVPVTLSPSYDNVGGQGNRTSLITVTQSGMFNTTPPDLSVAVNGLYYNPDLLLASASNVGDWLRFEFSLPVIITEISIDMGVVYGASDWVIRGSQDKITWAVLTDPFNLATPGGTGSSGGSEHATRTNQLVIPIDAPFAWKVYELQGISGNPGGGYLNQFEFKILGLE